MRSCGPVHPAARHRLGFILGSRNRGRARWAHRIPEHLPAPSVRAAPPPNQAVEFPQLKPLFVLILFTLFNHVTFCAARMLAPLNALALGVGSFTIGLMLSMVGLVAMVGSVHLGRWVDRNDVYRPMLISTIGIGVAMAVPALWQDVGALFILCLLSGAFWNVCYFATLHALGLSGTSEEKLNNFAIHSAMLSISNFLGPVLTGLLIDQGGFRVAACVLALFPLVPAIGLITRRVPVPRAAHPSVAPPVRSDNDRTDRKAKRGSALALLGHPTLRGMYYVSMLAQGIWNMYLFLLPAHLAAAGVSATAIGILLGWFALASIAVRVATSWIAARCARWTIMLWCMIFSTLALAALPLSAAMLPQMVIAAVLGTTLGIAGPVSLSLLNDAAPRDRAGEALGLRVTLLAGVQTVGPILAGVAAPSGGFGAAFVAMAVTCAIGVWVAAGHWRRERPAATRS